jgi:hypothetical protein
MPFIGNQPALSYTSFAKQDFSTSATTSYTLDNPVANANELALFINFVRQEPTTAYSASGTTLTLTSATASSDDMYCVYLGKAVQTVNPPNASVGLSQLTASGTKDATTFLRGDNTFNAVGVSNAFMTNGMSGNASGTLVFNNEILDDGGNYNTSNGRYTAPSDGKYIFFFHALSAGSASNIYFEVNGSTLGGMGVQWGYTHSGADPDTLTAILNLSQNDYVTAVAQSSVLASYIFFGGAKLY